MQTNKQLKELLRTVIRNGDVKISIDAPCADDRIFFEQVITRACEQDNQLTVRTTESPNTLRTVHISRKHVVLPTTAIGHLNAVCTALASSAGLDLNKDSLHIVSTTQRHYVALNHAAHYFNTADGVTEQDIMRYVISLQSENFSSHLGDDFYDVLKDAINFCFKHLEVK